LDGPGRAARIRAAAEGAGAVVAEAVVADVPFGPLSDCSKS
jgi:hypothetical protein